jgi:diguanylate cyclase (GGDEF)-like protein/PAS domain S-box-containing protein
LLVGLSVFALVLFSVIAIYNIQDGANKLSTVHERQVEPAAALLEMEGTLKDVRFRIAGFLLDQMPATGNIQHLGEAHARILSSWGNFLEKTRDNEFSDTDRTLIAGIGRNLVNIDVVFDRLAAGYRHDDRTALTAVLEDEWPFAIHVALLKPISQLVSAQQAAVRTAYENSVETGRQQIVLDIAFLTLVILLILTFAMRIVKALTGRLDTATEVARHVATGDWNADSEDTSPDEVGHLLRAIHHMRGQVRSRQERLRAVLDNTAEGIITFDESGIIESFNQSAEQLFGWSEDEVHGTSIALLISSDSRETRDDYLTHFLRAEIKRLIGHEGELVGRHKDGGSFPMALKISGMQLEGKQKYIALVSNISERKAFMEHLRHLAEHDGLTGLYNRSYFQAELERVVERIRRSEVANCALLYIDLDHFKYINDTLGHAAGDRLLIEASNILSRRARKSDLVARLGGDEFTVLVYDTALEHIFRVADSFRRLLADYDFHFEGQSVTVGCSIGVALIEPSAASMGEVMSRADLACHLAKRGGRNQVHVFSPEDAKNVTTMSLDMGWSRRIREAIDKNRFALACQPIVNTRTRAVSTYEVLIRMQDTNGELIMPGGFLPTAERFGLSLDIDRWVITHAIETLAEQRAVLPELSYTINLSAQTLNTPSICELVQEKLTTTGLEPAALIFEITETAAISDLNAAAGLLARLRQLGCRTALDDFGSGMSSFAYLKELPVDIVKIDGRFVKHIATNPVDEAMVRAMNDIAHALGKQTVAEFVENEAAFQKLIALGVDYAQGFHLGRPDIMSPCSAIAAHAKGIQACRT